MTYQMIFKAVQKAGYFEHHQRVLVAVSGGVDSMNLLHFLHDFRAELDIEIAIVHVNHGQRQESVEEEVYLRQWAAEKDLPIYIAQFEGKFSEKLARDFRYSFFRKIMAEEGYTALVTGHQADDQSETVLMRLIRGSRLRHLSALEPVSQLPEGQLIRPLLALSKSELPTPFHFEDESNQSSNFFRNRVRNDYLPKLRQENSQLDRHLQDLAEESSLLFEALADLTANLDVTNRKLFRQQTSAVQYYLLQAYLEQFSDLQLTKAQFAQVLHLLRTKTHYHQPLKSGYELILTKDEFVITKISPQTDSPRGQKVLEYNDRFSYAGYNFDFGDLDGLGVSLTSQSPILIRPVRAGDRLCLGGFSKKISRIFIDDKIPLVARRVALVGEQEGEILFVLAHGRTYLRKSLKNGTIKAKLHIDKETR